ncbi:MAG: haloalkane dehalogenase [Acidimicrobiia bacterium]|nr:haloalkane dehalogenase [Acidimicrobiia bacterium]
METLRTPEDRFSGLPGFDFEPHYASIDDLDGGELRVHHLDEGPRDADPVVLFHGEPSWCYLYRKVIPGLVSAGHRVIAPDLVGFGRSDKPASRHDYTYARHVEWMRQLLFDHLDLSSVTAFGQDWGGLISLRLLAEHPDRFARAVMGNTGLPTGDHPMPDAFTAWQKFSQEVPVLPVGAIVNGGCTSDLGEDVIAAYDAPFPDESFKEGARIFPTLVPTGPDDPAAADQRRAWEGLSQWTKPFVTAFSDGDPITKGGDALFQTVVPGAAGQRHTTIAGAGHFLQEDRGEEVAAAIVDAIASNPVIPVTGTDG